MKKTLGSQKSLILFAITGVLLLFFAVMGVLTWGMRKELRRQVINRDGEILMVVASAELDRVRVLNEGIIFPGEDEELFEVAINTSEIKGVIGVRVFKEGNVPVGAIPLEMKRGALKPTEEAVLKQKIPFSRFHSEFFLHDIILTLEEDVDEEPYFPVIEVIIPLFSLSDEEVSLPRKMGDMLC
jgi:hypothetical protein